MAPTADQQTMGFMPYERPPELSRCEAFRLLLWNPEKKAVLGRTWQSWGMGFRPIAEDVENAGSMIVYDAANNETIASWTNRIDEFLSPYEVKYDNQVVCDFNMSAPAGKVCEVKLSTFGNCVHENDYGFRNSAPCFFVKLNKIIGWTPKPYESSAECPDSMPDDLKKHIDSLPAEERKVIWVSCEGENPADKENIGELQYWPYQGFAAYYYPYMNTDNYVSPLVAVQLKRPVRNVLINIECRAWAHNIRYSKQKNEREGSVHLEVMVD
ncbi:Sodium/potassium-transporting ATPase subunit beta-1 [Gryllus bimaculatus]|nr:Sodium/potassium-transporting ATPase subunit beta-1 [Gryllus bimaculatus]